MHVGFLWNYIFNKTSYNNKIIVYNKFSIQMRHDSNTVCVILKNQKVELLFEIVFENGK